MICPLIPDHQFNTRMMTLDFGKTLWFFSIFMAGIGVSSFDFRHRIFKKLGLPSNMDLLTYSSVYTRFTELACSTACIHTAGCKSFAIKLDGECRLYSNAFLTGSNTDPDFTYFIRRGEDKTCVSIIGYEYNGYLATTRSNKPCLRWDTAAVSHPDANFIDGSKYAAENFCREPTLTDVIPWCYTSGTSWEYCNIGFCCLGSVSSYSGNVSRTMHGVTCQRWDSQVPHGHGYYTQTVHQNYCRWTSDVPGWTWCYTINSNIRWQHCSVKQCGY